VKTANSTAISILVTIISQIGIHQKAYTGLVSVRRKMKGTRQLTAKFPIVNKTTEIPCSSRRV
jgi:hypothetical protein